MALRDQIPLHYRRVLAKISSPACRIIFRRLRRRHTGVCFDKGTPKPTLVIHPGKDVIETLIHEATHAVYPDWPEQRVGWVARRIVQQLNHGQVVRLWRQVADRLVDTPSPLSHYLIILAPPQLSAARLQELRRAHRQVLHFLTYKPVAIGLFRLRNGTHGTCSLSDLPNRPLIVVDPRRNTLDAIIHEALHCIHPDWPEEKCNKIASDILRILTHRQIARLWRVLAARLREKPPLVYDELIENPPLAALPEDERRLYAVS